MLVDYFYCHYCGYEDFDCQVSYSYSTASHNLYICPHCKEESDGVEND